MVLFMSNSELLLVRRLENMSEVLKCMKSYVDALELSYLYNTLA